MPKTATAPALSPLPAHTARGAREQGRFRTASVEERTAALEARWEETVPTLATSKDISALENRLMKWVIGAGLALLAVFAAVFIANTARMDALDAKIDASVGKLDTRIDRLDAKIDSRFDALAARQDALDAKFDRLDAKMDARFDAIMAELREQRGK